VQNRKASKMFDSQPLGSVICSNYTDYNLIFLGTSILTLAPCPNCGDPSPFTCGRPKQKSEDMIGRADIENHLHSLLPVAMY